MRKILLNGRKMVDQSTVHIYLQEQLQLPSYYGRNLDALWDALSANNEELEIVLSHEQAMLNHLGNYGTSLKKILEESAQNNKRISFKVQ